MGQLFRYEMKKLLYRRTLWAALALGAVLSIIANQSMIRCALGDYIDGLKDGYAPYEGQIATDALIARVDEEYLAYVAAHPDDFVENRIDEETGEKFYWARYDNSYADGLCGAYIAVSQYETVEERHRRAGIFRKWLETGYTDDGKALTEYQKQSYAQSLEDLENSEPLVIRYPGGWWFVLNSPGSSISLLLLLLAVLGSLFTGDSTARMETLVLTSAQRGRSAATRLLAAGCCTLLFFVISYGPNVLVTALTYGLPDLTMPVSQVPQPTSPIYSIDGYAEEAMPLRQALLGIESAHLAASLACAAIVVFCSSALGRPLYSLLAAVAAIAVQIVAFSMTTPDALMIPGSSSRFNLAALLPASVLWQGSTLTESLGRTNLMAMIIIVSLALAALLTALAPRCWLRPRKN